MCYAEALKIIIMLIVVMLNCTFWVEWIICNFWAYEKVVRQKKIYSL